MSELNENLSAEDFEWVKQIGTGSYSEVYETIFKKTKKKFAIKRILKVLVSRAGMQKTLLIEKKSLLSLADSPYIIKLHDTFEDKTYLYFVLEFCPNGELFHLLKKKKTLSLGTTRQYAAEIVCAIENFKENKIVHRDLKPENIVLTKDYHLKIVDFGTAKYRKEQNIKGRQSLKNRSSQLANTLSGEKNTFCGTAQYMSPEILQDKKCTFSTDLWALGVIIFVMLTGSFPFKSPSPYIMFQKIQSRQINFPESMDPDAKDIIDKLLQLDRKLRLGANKEEGYFKPLKEHPFFKGINFDTLPTTPVPDIP